MRVPKNARVKSRERTKKKKFFSQPRAMGSTTAKFKTCDVTILHSS